MYEHQIVKIDDLIPYALNSRTHSEQQVAQIAASIREFGFTNPVLIDDQNNLIAGHGRVLAARKLKMSEVPAIIVTGLDERKRRALIIADNKLALNAGWDESALRVELEDLAGDFGELMGFSEDELVSLLQASNPTEGLTDEDAVPETPEEPITKPGDIWILGKHRLMCGDSTSVDAVDKLMQGQKADMVFTDPPYGVNYEGGHFHSGDVNITRKREKLVNDNSDQIYADVIPVIASFCDGPCYTWFADTKPLKLYQSVEALGEIHALIIWHKTNATYAAMNAQYKQRHEPCLYWKPKGSTLRWCGASTENTLWELKKDGKNSFHPTQKPVELSEKAISNHDAKVVLDLFGGSGSTMIGCEKTGRSCRMMELDPKYCDVIVKRWEEFTGKKAVLHEQA